MYKVYVYIQVHISDKSTTNHFATRSDFLWKGTSKSTTALCITNMYAMKSFHQLSSKFLSGEYWTLFQILNFLEQLLEYLIWNCLILYIYISLTVHLRTAEMTIWYSGDLEPTITKTYQTNIWLCFIIKEVTSIICMEYRFYNSI